jgi:hypothetical protein
VAVCREILAKTQPYHGGGATNTIRLYQGIWERNLWTPWRLRNIEWKCILCYRFYSMNDVGWKWYGATGVSRRSLVCLECVCKFP